MFTLNLTVGEYRRSNPIDMVSTWQRSDVAMVMWQDGEVIVRVHDVWCVGEYSRQIPKRCESCHKITKVKTCGSSKYIYSL